MGTIFGDMIRRSYKDEVRKEDQTTSTVKMTKFYNGVTSARFKLNGILLQPNKWVFRFNFRLVDERTPMYWQYRRFLILDENYKEDARSIVEDFINETIREIGGHLDGYDTEQLEKGEIVMSKKQDEFLNILDKKIDKNNSDFYFDSVEYDFIRTRKNSDDYYIKDGKVCCRSYVRVTKEDIVDGHFPVKFGYVGDHFFCDFCPSLTSLEGAPEYVAGNFFCQNCPSLTSLEGCTKKVGGIFDCDDCISLTSLEGCPESLGGDFFCYNCKSLTSLEGAPEHMGGNLVISSNMKHLVTPEIEEKYRVDIVKLKD